MKNKILKGILSLVFIKVTPFLMLAIVGIFYVLFKIITGASFAAGVQSFIDLINSLKPYLPYLTTVPVILVLAILFIKNKEKIIKLLKKQ